MRAYSCVYLWITIIDSDAVWVLCECPTYQYQSKNITFSKWPMSMILSNQIQPLNGSMWTRNKIICANLFSTIIFSRLCLSSINRIHNIIHGICLCACTVNTIIIIIMSKRLRTISNRTFVLFIYLFLYLLCLWYILLGWLVLNYIISTSQRSNIAIVNLSCSDDFSL